jgi:allantoinase
VDCHVHLNEPGRTDWEGFETGTRAAAAGGFTTIVEMPLNSIPSTTSLEALELKLAAARGKCTVDCAFWGGVVDGNPVSVTDLPVPGFKCFLVHPGTEEFHMVGEAQLRTVMPAIASRGLPLLVHAEVGGPIEQAALLLRDADWRTYETYLRSRPAEAEEQAIDLMIALSREYGCHVHIVHLSAATALAALKQARDEGVAITVETCPHYLFFTSEAIATGATSFKCAPPIRSAANQELLWRGLRDGIIDMIASDHSPCPPSMKLSEEGHFGRAWGGISSLSLSLPVVWTAARARRFELKDLVRWMSATPAKLAGFDHRKGAIREGCDADFVVFDSESPWTVTPTDLHFRHPISPYLGAQVTGKVKATVLRGEICFQSGLFPEPKRGIVLGI